MSGWSIVIGALFVVWLWLVVCISRPPRESVSKESSGRARARLLEVLEDDHRRFHDERRRVLLNRFPAYSVDLGLFDGLASVGELIRQPKTEWVPFDGIAAAPYMRDPWVDGFWSIEAYDLSAPGVPMRKVYRWVFP